MNNYDDFTDFRTLKSYQQQQSVPNLHSNRLENENLNGDKFASPGYQPYQKNMMQQQQLFQLQNQQQPNQQQDSPFEINFNESRPRQLQPGNNLNSLRDVIRIYVTLKKTSESNVEYKKLILMTPMNSKVSMLKRQIEKEFTDLFPKEQTYICGKLEDQYGYALSNSSFVYEMLKNGDRITAYPEDLISGNHVKGGQGIDDTFGPGQQLYLTTGDVTELLYLLRNVEQSISSKLADTNYKTSGQLEEVLFHIIPLGFSQGKAIVHNVAVVLAKIFSTERLGIFEEKDGGLLLNLLITLLNYWIAELMLLDTFLLTNIVELLEVLVKSALFCVSFKGGYVISNLMNASKVEFISAQTKSRLIKIISYLSKGEFRNYYSTEPISDMVQNKQIPKPDQQGYVPSFGKRKLSSRSGATISKPTTNMFDNIGNNQFGRFDTANQNKLPEAKPQMMMMDNDPLFKNKYDQGKDLRELDDSLYSDYLNLLTMGSTKDMHQFALQNLEFVIEKSAENIMQNRDHYMKCMNLIEIEVAPEYLRQQGKVLEVMAQNLTPERAGDGLQKNIIQRLLKAFSFQPADLHQTLHNLLQAHIVKGKYRIDLPVIISIILSPYARLHEFAIKVMSVLSDPAVSESNNYDIQFENHIKFLIELSLSKKKSYDFKNYALQTIANLSLKDSLKPQIVYNKGIEALIFHLRNEDNIDGQRLAAKALLNLSINSRENKLKIVTEIAEEIKRMHRNELDSVVQGYIQTLVNNVK